MTASREHTPTLTWLVWLVCTLLVFAYLLPVLQEARRRDQGAA